MIKKVKKINGFKSDRIQQIMRFSHDINRDIDTISLHYDIDKHSVVRILLTYGINHFNIDTFNYKDCIDFDLKKDPEVTSTYYIKSSLKVEMLNILEKLNNNYSKYSRKIDLNTLIRYIMRTSIMLYYTDGISIRCRLKDEQRQDVG